LPGINDFTYRVDPQCHGQNRSEIMAYLLVSNNLPDSQKNSGDPFQTSYGCFNDPSDWGNEKNPELTFTPAFTFGLVGAIFMIGSLALCCSSQECRGCNSAHSTWWVLLPMTIWCGIWYMTGIANAVRLSDARICTPLIGSRNAFGEAVNVNALHLKTTDVTGPVDTPDIEWLLTDPTAANCSNLEVIQDGTDRWWSVEFIPQSDLFLALQQLREHVQQSSVYIFLFIPALILTDIHVIAYWVFSRCSNRCDLTKCQNWCSNIRKACWACLLICAGRNPEPVETASVVVLVNPNAASPPNVLAEFKASAPPGGAQTAHSSV
jgi:hypothetical protein